jgi:hypothetical protein
MAESPRLPDRIQRDLEEALRQGGVDKLPSRKKPPRRQFKLGWPDPRPRNPGELVLIGAALFVLWFVLNGFAFRTHILVFAIACVLIAVVTHFIKPHGHTRHYWRGRYLDIPSGAWQERLYRIIYRRSS